MLTSGCVGFTGLLLGIPIMLDTTQVGFRIAVRGASAHPDLIAWHIHSASHLWMKFRDRTRCTWW